MRRVSEPRWVEVSDGVFRYRSTCNSYVLKHESAGLVIDCGAADLLDHLGEIEIQTLEWALFTHHHREQCQGASLLTPQTRIAVPAAEAELFCRLEAHWGNVDDRSVVGSPYVRPLREGIRVDRRLTPWEDLNFGPFRLTTYPTPGNSPGAVSFLCEVNGRRLCFSGDLMLDGGTLHNYYDSEWDYGELTGITALMSSVLRVAQDEPDLLCPSHGPVVRNAETQLRSFASRLERFIGLLRRDYDRNGIDRWTASRPTEVGGIRRISDHLLKGSGNLAVILADSGSALLVDCGVLLPESEAWLSAKCDALEAHFGLKMVEAVIVTHYHGDHVLDVPVVTERYGSQVWAYENFVDILENPDRYSLSALLPAYRRAHTRVAVHRVLRDGESLTWQGMEFHVCHLPGQTEYSMGIHAHIDGRKVLLSGDNIWYSPGATSHRVDSASRPG